MTNLITDSIYRAPQIPIGSMLIDVLKGLPVANYIRKSGLDCIYHAREVSRIALQLSAILQIDPELIDYLRLCCEFTAFLNYPEVLSELINRIKANIQTHSWSNRSRRLMIEILDNIFLENKGESNQTSLGLSEPASIINTLWQASKELEFRYNPKYNQKYTFNAPVFRVYLDDKSVGIIYTCNNSADLKLTFDNWIKHSTLLKRFPELEIRFLKDDWWDHAITSIKPILCVGHFDAHGYSAAGVTYNALRNLGVEVELYLGYCKTGELGRFWKRTFIDLLKLDKYEYIVLHDLTIDSRHPSRTASALEQVQNYNCKVVICDHHQDTALYISHLIEPNVRIYLSDAAGCQWSPNINDSQREFAISGAETDKEWHLPVPKLPNIPESGGNRKMDQWVNTLSNFIKYPKLHINKLEDCLSIAAGNLNYNIEELIDQSWLQSNLESNEQENRQETYLQTSNSIKISDLKYKIDGRVALFTERPPSSGRTWYQIMEEVMNTTKLENSQDDPYFIYIKCPYSIAFRLVNPKMFNILLLTHWAEPAAIPIGHFIPDGYTSVGYISACWCDVAVNELPEFIEKIVQDINSVYSDINL